MEINKQTMCSSESVACCQASRLLGSIALASFTLILASLSYIASRKRNHFVTLRLSSSGIAYSRPHRSEASCGWLSTPMSV